MAERQDPFPGETFDWARDESASAAVVRAVAEVVESGPTDIEPLHGAVDPDALNALFSARGRPDRAALSAEFVYAGCRVRIDGNGRGRITVVA